MAKRKRVAPTGEHALPGERLTEFSDAEGRTLESGDYIRVDCHPQSWRFKVRHLHRTPEGKEWIEAFGPFDKFGNVSTTNANRIPKYRSFRPDQVTAKCRVQQ